MGPCHRTGSMKKNHEVGGSDVDEQHTPHAGGRVFQGASGEPIPEGWHRCWPGNSACHKQHGESSPQRSSTQSAQAPAGRQPPSLSRAGFCVGLRPPRGVEQQTRQRAPDLLRTANLQTQTRVTTRGAMVVAGAGDRTPSTQVLLQDTSTVCFNHIRRLPLPGQEGLPQTAGWLTPKHVRACCGVWMRG